MITNIPPSGPLYDLKHLKSNRQKNANDQYKRRNWTLVCFWMKPRISKTNEFYARERNHFQSAQQEDIGIYLCAPRDKHSQTTSRSGHDARLSLPKGSCSSLAKISTNLRVAKSNGVSVFISLLSCIQHSWTLPPETLSVSILLASRASLGLDLPSTYLVTSSQAS